MSLLNVTVVIGFSSWSVAWTVKLAMPCTPPEDSSAIVKLDSEANLFNWFFCTKQRNGARDVRFAQWRLGETENCSQKWLTSEGSVAPKIRAKTFDALQSMTLWADSCWQFSTMNVTSWCWGFCSAFNHWSANVEVSISIHGALPVTIGWRNFKTKFVIWGKILKNKGLNSSATCEA